MQYDLPELKELLEETYGVIVYQEQVMQISNRLAGYSLGDADLLRRAMGKKKLEEMAKQRERFIEGALERGFPQKKIEKIFDLMEQFAGYGFNKSHSAAYAYLAFVTAYLKAHYPGGFHGGAADFGNREHGEGREVHQRMPRDGDHDPAAGREPFSEWSFTPDGQAIRFGLGAVKNLGQSAVEAIGRAREEVGRFASLHQFCEKVDLGAVNRRMIESLISAGRDGFARRDAQPEVRRRGRRDGSGAARLARPGDAARWGFSAKSSADEPHTAPLPNVPDWTDKEKLAGEKELLGFWVTGHPLDRYADKIAELATHDSGQPGRPGEEYRGGFVRRADGNHAEAQQRRQAVGRHDDRGPQRQSWKALLFASSYERLASQVVEDQAVLVRGLVLPEENAAPKISVQDIVALDNARIDLPSVISIRVWLGRNGGVDRAQALEEIFRSKPGGTAGAAAAGGAARLRGAAGRSGEGAAR